LNLIQFIIVISSRNVAHTATCISSPLTSLLICETLKISSCRKVFK